MIVAQFNVTRKRKKTGIGAHQQNLEPIDHDYCGVPTRGVEYRSRLGIQNFKKSNGNCAHKYSGKYAKLRVPQIQTYLHQEFHINFSNIFHGIEIHPEKIGMHSK